MGTAGWTYAYFRRSLRRYAECFDGVEVDSSFYAIPSSRVVARWTQLTPRHFTFDVKLHRLLSRHAAPLSSLPVDLRAGAQTAESGRVMLDRSLEQALCSRTLAAMEPLRTSGKLSSFLLQLTPAFKPLRTSAHRAGAAAQLPRARSGSRRTAPPRVAARPRNDAGLVQGRARRIRECRCARCQGAARSAEDRRGDARRSRLHARTRPERGQVPTWTYRRRAV